MADTVKVTESGRCCNAQFCMAHMRKEILEVFVTVIQGPRPRGSPVKNFARDIKHGAPTYRLASFMVVLEVSAIAASKWCFFIGYGHSGCGDK